VEGKGIIGVEELVEYLKIDIKKTTKTLLFQADDKVIAAMIRGDFDINETKLKNYLGCTYLTLATPEVVKKLTGAEVGFAGPVGLPKEIKVVADITCKDRVNFEAGGNETHFHNLNVNFERDFPTPAFVDIRAVKEGDLCPKCLKGRLKEAKTIELGHVFKLGTVYSEKMKANFTDKDGIAKPMEMGCYGIGISRILSAVVETSHDEKGMIWPKSIAPYLVHLIVLGSDKQVIEKADKIYEDLEKAGFEVLYDDREDTAGVKFADADLIGIPLRILVSEKSLDKGGVEFKERAKKDSEIVTTKDLKKKIESFIAG
ncbi:MAG: YbaK/EbsC family protein, partial [Candidatus Gracilibacteria bacterium]